MTKENPPTHDEVVLALVEWTMDDIVALLLRRGQVALDQALLNGRANEIKMASD